MIYLLLYWEFFKIGLFAIGGGLVTVPFLYNLADVYSWFSTQELTDMIAVAESTPGPIGVNMATYAGFKTIGISGGIVATMGLITPSLLIIICLAKWLMENPSVTRLDEVMKFIRPAVLALILSAGWLIAKMAITSWMLAIELGVVWCVIHFWKKHPIFYIVAGAVLGIILG